MMPRKKRRTILIVSIIIVLVILLAVIAFLYVNTDMLKSDSTLFAKYIGQNVENIDKNYRKMWITNEYDQLLEENKYTTQTQVKVNYIESIGTSSENTKNSINQLKLEVSGQTDKQNQYSYQDINLLKNDEDIAELEYIQNKEVYGIRFSDLFRQYILVDNDDLEKVMQNTTLNEDQMKLMLGSSEFSEELKDIFSITEEEKKELKTKYINIINKNVSKENFSKQKNQTIQIDGKNTNVNAYILTLTKEKMNRLYIEILEELKKDEIILGKIDQIQTLIEKYQVKEIGTLREKFAPKIDELIAQITKNNIGQEEAQLIVYENYHNTVRTLIRLPEYEISIDQLDVQDENYREISFKDITNKKEETFSLKKTSQKLSLSLETTQGEEIEKYSLEIGEKIDGKKCTKNTIFGYEDDSNRVEATINQEINIIDELEDDIIFKEENYINLSELEEEQVTSIVNQVNSKVSEKVSQITSDIKLEDLFNVLKVVGIVKEEQKFEVEGITETEKNRFNSKFEILQGENLDSAAVLKIIDAIQENFINIEVVSSKELKLKLDRLNKNEEMTTILTTFLEENKSKKYNANMEYDEETGLVSDIVLTMIER